MRVKTGVLLMLACAVAMPPVASSQTALSPGSVVVGTTDNGVQVRAAVRVWPKGAPAAANWPGVIALPVSEELRNDGSTLWNVTDPSIQAFLPSPEKSTGAAVIIVPGGGFRMLAIKHEGNDLALWFAERGITAFVLKYRTIQTPPGESGEAMRARVQKIQPISDAGIAGVADGLEALRVVRARASEYDIDPARTGVVGFSAGGHVASMMALNENVDERPAFAGLIYGMPFAPELAPLPPANLPFPPGTPTEPWLQPKATPAPGRLPPMFMAFAQDDLAVGRGFRDFYDRLFEAGYRPELHLYQRGGHGFGTRLTGTTVDHWLDEFYWWIAGEGITRKN